MKNLNALVNECMGELNAIGIKTGTIVSYKVNTRAKTRWGLCSYNRLTNEYSIEISSRLMADDVSDIATKTTMLHEMLHTCPDCMNHGYSWQREADKVNSAYGYHIRRTTSAEDKGVTPYESTEKVHYVLRCEGCGSVWKYKRYSKIVQNAERNNTQCGCGCKRISVTHI